MRTNDLFREVLDGRIPMPRKRTGGRTRIIFIPVGSFDPTAPTITDLAKAIHYTSAIALGMEAAAREEEREARNRAIANAATAAGQSFADMEAALMAFGEAAQNAAECTVLATYVMPPPKPWAGNIATQKRRRRL